MKLGPMAASAGAAPVPVRAATMQTTAAADAVRTRDRVMSIDVSGFRAGSVMPGGEVASCMTNGDGRYGPRVTRGAADAGEGLHRPVAGSGKTGSASKQTIQQHLWRVCYRTMKLVKDPAWAKSL
ncbi:hypothetical protein Are01nite_72720 [Actinoplanes regularis]|nr:hypothetical protein Are01nite_72720 [Actinoplanes regularis]